MKTRHLPIKTLLARFLFAPLLFGFLTVSAATAALPENKSGTWVDKQYAMHGEWSVEQRGDQQVITFSDSFKTKKGPDLKIFLSPQSIDDATGKTATQNAVLISPLKNNKGAQEYVIPDNIDLNDFKSLLIHCEAFSVLWGGTNI